jgi:hypothetical protein
MTKENNPLAVQAGMFKSRYQSCQVQILGKFRVEEVPGYLNCMVLLLLELVLESSLEAVLLLKFEP